MQEKWWSRVWQTIKKRWLLIAIIAVVIIVIAIPSGFVLGMHNSTYDCSFQYVKYDDLVTEIARKHIYYNAGDKTVEVALNQDMINSLIKDLLETQDLGLPKNISVKEVLFNTKDQRIYINAKYGNLNVPLSLKVSLNILDSGLNVTVSDIKLGEKNAPGFIKKQIPADMLKYSIKYEDFDIPQIFAVKDVQFGSGSIKALIQLDADKIADLALDYYKKDVAGEIDKFKNTQPGIIGTFVNKVLGTGVLSDAKVKDYIMQALNNEELMNSAIYFATAGDLGKYTKSIQEAQEKIAGWAAPLQVLKYYGSIDETVDTILYNEQLREFLGWFLSPGEIDEYTLTAEEYFALYKNYYGMYEDLVASLGKTVNSINTKNIEDTVKFLTDYAKQAEDAREFLIDQVDAIDAEKIEKLIAYLENDDGYGREFIDSLDPDAYSMVRDYLADASSTKASWLAQLGGVDLSLVNEFTNVLDNRKKFTFNVINDLKGEQYLDAVDRLQQDGVYDKKTKTFVDNLTKEIDLAITDFSTAQ